MDRTRKINQALALHRSGQTDAAASLYESLLRGGGQPDPGLLHLLGLVRYQQRRFGEAVELIDRAIALSPREPMFHFNQGKVLADTGRIDAACASYRAAIGLQPTFAAAHVNLGSTLGQLLRHRESIAATQQALRLAPQDDVAHEMVAMSYRHLGNVEEARCHLREAYKISLRPALRVKEALLLPPLVESTDEIQSIRERLLGDLDRLARECGPINDPVHEVGTTHFYLSYHGLPNRELVRKLATLYRQVCPDLGYVASHCRDYRGPQGRIRVGFLSKYLYLHSIGKTTSGLVAKLDRSRFEVHVIGLPPPVEDELANFIRSSADHAIEVPADFRRAQQAIADLKLDVLFYQDIGMEPMSYFLAFSRLAPVQCVSFGHPDTTGIPAMDWFVSSRLFEREGAEADYSERLFLLEECGTLAYYYRPLTPSAPLSRQELGLPAAGTFYLCPQTLFKMHPDFDPMLADILCRDAGGFLVLLKGSVPEWAERVRARLGQIAPEVVDRVHLLPKIPVDQFTAMVAACDVMLDTPYFNGMNTSLEAFAVGTPVVTMPTQLQLGRHTAGMYRAMGIPQAIATTPEDYVRMAVELGTDPSARSALSAEILARNGCLFENPQVVREFERFFETAVAQAAQTSAADAFDWSGVGPGEGGARPPIALDPRNQRSR